MIAYLHHAIKRADGFPWCEASANRSAAIYCGLARLLVHSNLSWAPCIIPRIGITVVVQTRQGVAHENRGRKIGKMGSQKQERKQSIMWFNPNRRQADSSLQPPIQAGIQSYDFSCSHRHQFSVCSQNRCHTMKERPILRRIHCSRLWLL